MAMSMATLIILVALVATLLAGLFVFKLVGTYRQKAIKAGYGSLGEYLRSAPRSDEEKRESVDLVLKGLVICILGILFPPLVLIGVVPLYYGARKLAFGSMGFGLVDDAVPPSR